MTDLAELIGFMLILTGLGTIVAAASYVSTALAVLTAGVFLAAIGAAVVLAAAKLDTHRKAEKAKQVPPTVA